MQQKDLMLVRYRVSMMSREGARMRHCSCITCANCTGREGETTDHKLSLIFFFVLFFFLVFFFVCAYLC